MYIYMYVQLCVPVHTCGGPRRLLGILPCRSLPCPFKTGFLTEHGICCFLCRLDTTQPLFCPALRRQAHVATHGFHVDKMSESKDSDSGLPAFMGTFTPKTAPQSTKQCVEETFCGDCT